MGTGAPLLIAASRGVGHAILQHGRSGAVLIDPPPEPPFAQMLKLAERLTADERAELREMLKPHEEKL